RRYTNKRYTIINLGLADDVVGGLSFIDAETAARAAAGAVPFGRLTVAQAMANHIAHKQALGQYVTDIVCRIKLHILPQLGNCLVTELTTDQLQQWLTATATAPARNKPPPATDEHIRARRASANRMLAILKAALNNAYIAGHVPSRTAWERVRPFRNVTR